MSAMTDIRDRLKASGDEEAATALDVAMRAAGDRLEQLEQARKRIGELERELGRDEEDFPPDIKPMAKETYDECMRIAKD